MFRPAVHIIGVALCILTITYCSFSPQTVTAQSTTRIGNAVNLTVSPNYPEPESSVVIALEAYTTNTIGATVSWFIDGVEQPDFENDRSILITTGKLGTKQVVRAQISGSQSGVIKVDTVIAPSRTDIILESDTYTPIFYAGRALPSMSASIRAIAIPLQESTTHPSRYSYDWKLNDSSMFGGPVFGKQAIDFSMPRFGEETLSVTIFDTDGTTVGHKRITLESVEPELHFYEDNPLRGMSRKAITDTHVLIGDEVTVRGEPFFMNTALASETGDYAWSINNQPVIAGNLSPNAITLRRSDQPGIVTIGLEIITKNRIPQLIEGVFNIFTE